MLLPDVIGPVATLNALPRTHPSTWHLADVLERRADDLMATPPSNNDELLAQEDFLLISMLGTPRARCFPLRAACVSLLPHAVRSLFSMCGVGSRPGHCLVAESGGVCCPCLSAAITSGRARSRHLFAWLI